MPAFAHSSAEGASTGLVGVGKIANASELALPVAGQRWLENYEIAEVLPGDSTQQLWRGKAVDTDEPVTLRAFRPSDLETRVHTWKKMVGLDSPHLQRARADSRVDFDQVLDENVKRILAEIDHLDEIARAFSRYGAAPNTRPAAKPTDVAATVRDLIGLERMGDERIQWGLDGADGACMALAQRDELREVLLNVYENARLAGATAIGTTLTVDDAVSIEVRDDGHGIPADLLSRVFEPHFSTRTSGSGLGLAISRQLIEGWGGTIDVESEQGKGSVVRILLQPA